MQMTYTSYNSVAMMTFTRFRWKILALSLICFISMVGIIYQSTTISFYNSFNEQSFYALIKKRIDEQAVKPESNSNLVDFHTPNETPQYMMTLHQLHEQIKDLWNHAAQEIKVAVAEKDHVKRSNTLQALLTDLKNRKILLMSEQLRLKKMDSRKDWREEEAAIASDLVQQHLREIHNPPDCKAAKKIVCFLNYYCGFGCYVHHMTYCLQVAYLTNRLVVFNQEKWIYAPRWRSLFKPLSEKCENDTFNFAGAAKWPSAESDRAHLVYIKDKAPIPLGVPENLASRVLSFNGDPGAWFVGQILKYILRPRPSFQKTIDNTIMKFNFQHPVVGIHVRRTDKLYKEARFHSLEEYMQHAKEYWIIQDTVRKPGSPPTPKRVYLACDDVKVFEEARRKYPGVEFIGDKKIASSASVKNRTSAESLTGIVVDIILLSRVDYLVCTLTSNVGLAAYELMNANRPDASESVVSLDDTYHFSGNYLYRVKQRHKPERPEELSLEIGDIIKVKRRIVFSGYGLGRILNTYRTGLFAYYKAEPFPLLYNHTFSYKDLIKNRLI